MNGTDLKNKFLNFSVDYIETYYPEEDLDFLTSYLFIEELITSFKKKTRINLFKHFSTHDVRSTYLSCLYLVELGRIKNIYKDKLDEEIDYCRDKDFA